MQRQGFSYDNAHYFARKEKFNLSSKLLHRSTLVEKTALDDFEQSTTENFLAPSDLLESIQVYAAHLAQQRNDTYLFELLKPDALLALGIFASEWIMHIAGLQHKPLENELAKWKDLSSYFVHIQKKIHQIKRLRVMGAPTQVKREAKNNLKLLLANEKAMQLDHNLINEVEKLIESNEDDVDPVMKEIPQIDPQLDDILNNFITQAIPEKKKKKLKSPSIMSPKAGSSRAEANEPGTAPEGNTNQESGAPQPETGSVPLNLPLTGKIKRKREHLLNLEDLPTNKRVATAQVLLNDQNEPTVPLTLNRPAAKKKRKAGAKLNILSRLGRNLPK